MKKLILPLILLVVLAVVISRMSEVKTGKIDLNDLPGVYYLANAKEIDRESYWSYVILEMTGNRDLVKVAKCESRFVSTAVGDRGLSRGIFQFKQATFFWFAKEAGIEKPDWNNNFHQIRAAEWGFNNKKEAHWLICARKNGLLK